MLHKFKILPEGLIKSGTAGYELSNDLHEIDYHIEAKVGWLFFTKTLSYLGTYEVDPNLLLSETFKLGEKKVIGNITFQVAATTKDSALVVFDGPSKLRGSAKLDTSEKVAVIQTLTATLEAAGRDVKLILEPSK